MLWESIKRTGKVVFSLLPKNKYFDSVYFFAHFLVAHRRFPRRNSGLINDYFFFLKADQKLADAARQFTSDKEYVKYFIQAKIGSKSIIRTLDVLTEGSRIDEFRAKEPCILKPSHLSGLVVRLDVGESLNGQQCESLKSALKRNLYDDNRELNYKNLPARILVEEDLGNGEQIKDYKVFFYKGTRKLIQVDSDRFTRHKRNLYDTNWSPLPYVYNKPHGSWESPPVILDRMLECANLLSEDFESARIDFFVTDSGIYVGEITHCPEQAHGRFENLKAERAVSEIFFGDQQT